MVSQKSLLSVCCNAHVKFSRADSDKCFCYYCGESLSVSDCIFIDADDILGVLYNG